MLLRTHRLSMRTLMQLALAALLPLTAAGTASAANQGNPPLLVPYTVQTIAGMPQYATGKTVGGAGYAGDGGLATPVVGFCDQPTSPGSAGCPQLATPYAVAIDSVGNVYFTDSGNDVIREVNVATGVLNTIAGADPKGCSGSVCSNKFPGCSDGIAALGNPIGGHLSGIAVDAYGNIYFADNALDALWVIYRGGTQVANFIMLEDPTGVQTSGGKVQVGYVYQIAGLLTSCAGNAGNTDGVLATQGQLRAPQMVSLDSAGNIYIADTGNQTVRVINTQATAQTFFQYTVPPGFIQSIVNCSAALTVGCPPATTATTGTGINGPANGIVFNSQYKGAEADQYGNVYQFNGTGSGTGAPGIYIPVAYAGGTPLTTLLTVEAPRIAQDFGTNSATCKTGPPACSPDELPLMYGSAYPVVNDPGAAGASLNAALTVQAVYTNGTYDVRPSDLTIDPFGTMWFLDNHYPYILRIDQYTNTMMYVIGHSRGTTSGGPYTTAATFQNPWYCVYGSLKLPWTQGPQSVDPLGDNCPAIIANLGISGTGSNVPTLKADGLGQVYEPDGSNSVIRELPLGNFFPPTPLGGGSNEAPVTQGIQVHFDGSGPSPGNNPPIIGASANVGSGVFTTSSFSIVGGSDFTIDTTTPEFAAGTLGLSGYNNTSGGTFAMWAGQPTCYQAGTAVGDLSWDCLVYVKFNPTAPGLRTAQLLVTTANGSKYDFSLTGIGQGGQLAIDGGQQATFASSGLGNTAGIAVSSTGVVYIADPANNRIVSCPVGTLPCASPTALPQPASLKPATLSGPKGVATDAGGNVYIADTGNNRVLEYNLATTAWTVLGNNVFIGGVAGSGGTTTASAPGGTVPQYAFKAPQGLAVDKIGNVYVADTGNGAIVEIPQNTSLGGAAPLFQYPNAPTFVSPVGVAVDANGFVYVADPGNPAGQVFKIPPGGGDLQAPSGNAYSALFPSLPHTQINATITPNGVAVDGAGNVYVSDSSANAVWVAPAAGPPNGLPYTLNFIGLSAPAGLALDASGNLYVADSGNKQVLFSNRQNPVINFGTVPQAAPAAQPVCPATTLSDGLNNQGTTGCVLTVTNIGNKSISLTSPITSITNANPAFNITNNCGASLPSGTSCTITATFQPTSNGAQSENVNVNGTNSMALLATTNAVGAQPQVNIVLTSSAGSSPAVNSTPTITATVSQLHPPSTPTGTVTFTYTIDAGTYQAAKCGSGGSSTQSLSGGVATFTMPSVAQGLQYTVSANYNGDSLDSPTQAVPLVLTVPPVAETVTAASVSYTYGQPVPTLTGTVTPALPSGLTATFTSGASQYSNVGVYPIQVQFSGTNACAYGFPSATNSGTGGGPATVTENPAPLTVVIPAYTTVYGAASFNYASGMKITGAVGNDLAKFSATFTPPDSSVLDVNPAAPAVNPYPVVATLTGTPVGNYTIKYTNGTDTVTPAPSGTSVTQSATSVLSGSQNGTSFSLLASTLVAAGKGIPTGSITVTDSFVPIDASTFGPACSANLTTYCNNAINVPLCSSTVTTNCIPPCSATVKANCSPLPLSAGAASFSLASTFTAPGTHNFTFTYSGDPAGTGDGRADFQCSVVGGPATSNCPTTGPTPISLIVDYQDVNLTSTTGPLIIVPGVTPSGLGLASAPGQNSSYPETAAISVNPVLGFVGTVTMGCTTQNPSYVSCSMTPPTVCFNSDGSSGCTKNTGSVAAILSVSTPATLPLGFKTSELRTSTGKAVLAFLPLGVLAFCLRRRRRLSQALWMLIVLCGLSAGMSGCGGGNQVAFYTPVPTGPQTVTVTATYTSSGTPLLCGGASSCTITRSFLVPINID